MEPAIDPPQLLHNLFDVAVRSVHPSHILPPYLEKHALNLPLILAAGKAAGIMAQISEQHYTSQIRGLAVSPYANSVTLTHIKEITAGHPTPNQASRQAATEMLQMANALGEGDTLLFLLSGGASALTTCPPEGVSLDGLKSINKALLASGADIKEINIVRKHLSDFNGGRLAAQAYPAKTITLTISDVPGDDRETIGSGPTTPDGATSKDALNILKKYQVTTSNAIIHHLQNQASESIKSDDPRLSNNHYEIIATAKTALDAAETSLNELQIPVFNLGDRVEGEAAQVAQDHANYALELKQNNHHGVIISGGELTVTGAQGDEGGPNREYALALAIALGGDNNIHALSADTDGIDGKGQIAGAIIGPGTLSHAQSIGLDPAQMLANHQSGDFFKLVGSELNTGPTLTNISDFRAIFISPDEEATRP